MADRDKELGIADRVKRTKESFKLGIKIEKQESGITERTKVLSPSAYTAELYGARPPGSGPSSASTISPMPPTSSSPLGRPARPSIFRETSGSGTASPSHLSQGGVSSHDASPSKTGDDSFKLQRMAYQELLQKNSAAAATNAVDASTSSLGGPVGAPAAGAAAAATALADALHLMRESGSGGLEGAAGITDEHAAPAPPAPQPPVSADLEPPSAKGLLARLDRRFSSNGTASPSSSHASTPRAGGGPGHTINSLGGGVLAQDPAMPHSVLRAKRTSFSGSHPSSPLGSPAIGGASLGGGGLFAAMLTNSPQHSVLANTSPLGSPMRSASPLPSGSPIGTPSAARSTMRASLLARAATSEGGILAQPDDERISIGWVGAPEPPRPPKEEDGDTGSVRASRTTLSPGGSASMLQRTNSKRASVSTVGGGPGGTSTLSVGGNLGLALGAAFSKPGVISGAVARTSAKRV